MSAAQDAVKAMTEFANALERVHKAAADYNDQLRLLLAALRRSYER